MYVLRDKRTLVPINVAYSPEGLLWTTDKFGKLVCFKNARIALSEDKTYIYPKGLTPNGLERNDSVIIEKYVPMDHVDKYGRLIMRRQSVEFSIAKKASKMLLDMNNTRDPVSQVYTNSN